jgi:hypothetical protein
VLGALIVGVLAMAGPAAAADDIKLEVRTWTGQTWRLSQATFDLFSTVVPTTQEEGKVAPQSDATALVGGTGRSRAALFGSPQELGALFEKRAEPLQVRRDATSVGIVKGGVETRVPLDRIASLLFYRQPLWASPLPPYVAPSHFRYSATAVLTDGSRVEGDYVNLGTLRVRGTGPQGRVDMPWEELEVVRFER